jgi:hypothetical protein
VPSTAFFTVSQGSNLRKLQGWPTSAKKYFPECKLEPAAGCGSDGLRRYLISERREHKQFFIIAYSVSRKKSDLRQNSKN